MTSAASDRHRNAHQMLAWGVLGSASDGLPFLLTHPVVFRSISIIKRQKSDKLRLNL